MSSGDLPLPKDHVPTKGVGIMVAAVTTMKIVGHLGSHISSFGSHISSFVGENLCCVRNPGGTWGMVTDRHEGAGMVEPSRWNSLRFAITSTCMLSTFQGNKEVKMHIAICTYCRVTVGYLNKNC